MAIELDGTYHDLARFFDHISKVPRIINVGAIAVKAKDAKEAGDGSTITATCTATTFVLLDKAAQAEAEPVKTKKKKPGAAAAKAPNAAK